MVRIRSDRLLSEDSLMPLWATEELMDASVVGDAVSVGDVTAWMGPKDSGLVVEVSSKATYTPIVRVLASSGGAGWIDSIYLREMKV